MEWRLFLLQLVDSLAWPAAAVIIFLLLRRPILELMPSVQLLRHRDFDPQLRLRAEGVLDRVDDASVEVAEDEPTAPEAWRVTAALAQVSPRSAVLEAWRLVDAEYVVRADRPGRAASTLDGETRAALHELRALRDQAATVPDSAVGPSSADTYVEAAYAVSLRLTRLPAAS